MKKKNKNLLIVGSIVLIIIIALFFIIKPRMEVFVYDDYGIYSFAKPEFLSNYVPTNKTIACWVIDWHNYKPGNWDGKEPRIIQDEYGCDMYSFSGTDYYQRTGTSAHYTQDDCLSPANDAPGDGFICTQPKYPNAGGYYRGDERVWNFHRGSFTVGGKRQDIEINPPITQYINVNKKVGINNFVGYYNQHQPGDARCVINGSSTMGYGPAGDSWDCQAKHAYTVSGGTDYEYERLTSRGVYWVNPAPEIVGIDNKFFYSGKKLNPDQNYYMDDGNFVYSGDLTILADLRNVDLKFDIQGGVAIIYVNKKQFFVYGNRRDKINVEIIQSKLNPLMYGIKAGGIVQELTYDFTWNSYGGVKWVGDACVRDIPECGEDLTGWDSVKNAQCRLDDDYCIRGADIGTSLFDGRILVTIHNNGGAKISNIRFKHQFGCKLEDNQLNVMKRFGEGSEVSVNSFGNVVDKFCLGMPVIRRSYSEKGLDSTAEPYEALARGNTLTVPDGQYWDFFVIVTNNGSLKNCGSDEALFDNVCKKVGLTSVQCVKDSDCSTGYECDLSTNFCSASKLIGNLQQQISDLQGNLNAQLRVIEDLNLNAVQNAELISNLQLSIQTQLDLIERLGKTQDEKDSMIAVMLTTISNQSSKINELNSIVSINADIIIKMNASIEVQLGVIESLRISQSQKDLMIATMLSAISTQENKINELNNIVVINADIISKMNASIETQLRVIESLRISQVEKQSIIEDLLLRLNLQELRIVELSNAQSVKEQVIAAMNERLSAQDKLINELSISKAEKEALIIRLLNDLSIQEQQVSELRGLNSAQATTIISLGADIEAQVKIINDLKLSKAEKEVLINDLSQQIIFQQQKIVLMQELARQLSNDYDIAKAQILELQKTLSNADDRITLLLVSIDELRLSNAQVTDLLRSYEGKLEEDVLLINSLRAKNYDLGVLLKQYEGDLAKEKAVIVLLNLSNADMALAIKVYEEQLYYERGLVKKLESESIDLNKLISDYKLQVLSQKEVIAKLQISEAEFKALVKEYDIQLFEQKSLVIKLKGENIYLSNLLNDYKLQVLSQKDIISKLQISEAEFKQLVKDYDAQLLEQKLLVSTLKSENVNLDTLISEYKNNLLSEQAITSQLKISNEQLSLLLKDYDEKLIEQARLINDLKKESFDEKEIIESLKLSLQEQEDLLKELRKQKSLLVINFNQFVIGTIIVLLIGFIVYFVFRKKKRK